MANKQHLAILKQGAEAWNKWRARNSDIDPDLYRADLSRSRFVGIELIGADLRGADLTGMLLYRALLSGADLSGANLSKANLTGAELGLARLRGANLSDANLTHANLSRANMSNANLRHADLSGVDFSGANLIGAVITEVDLGQANFTRAELQRANLHKAKLRGTFFVDVDLSKVKRLEDVIHKGPSEISISTIYRSKGNIPETFLRGAGVPENYIAYMHSLAGQPNAFEFYSCFISYSSKDQTFAERLHSKLRDAKIRVWFAPEDVKGGEKLYEQIDRAIQAYDRLLLVLSENSLQSEWVMTEIRRARKAEIREKRRKLFPIRLVDYEAIKAWECFDSESGKDLAVEVREYFIPDFSDWKEHDAFEAAFAHLLRDLQANELEKR